MALLVQQMIAVARATKKIVPLPVAASKSGIVDNEGSAENTATRESLQNVLREDDERKVPPTTDKNTIITLEDLETPVKLYKFCGKVLADAALQRRCLLPPNLEKIIPTEWVKKADEEGEFTEVLRLADISRHSNVKK